MASAEEYANWIVQNQAKKGTPEFETVARAYQVAKGQTRPQVTEQSAPLKMGKDRFADDLRETLQEANWGTRNIAGAGTALSDLWQGAKQLVGQGDQQAIENNRIIKEEAPVGAIAGNVALTALPFANAGTSLKAAAGVGAGLGALQPVEGEQTLGNITKGKLINTAIGAGSGVAGQAVANKVSGMVTNKLSNLALKKAQNAELDRTLQESVQVGYKLPPSMMPDSGVTSRILEGVSGKYKTNQLAGIKNQEVTNSLARQALSLPDDVPLTRASLDKVREAAYSPYREISALPKVSPTKANTLANIPEAKGIDPAKSLESLKQARNDAQSWFNAYNRSASPEDLAKARGFQTQADSLEKGLEDYAQVIGRSDLVDRLREARKMIAKTYTVERALKPGSGNVDAKVLGRLFEKNKPLSGGLDVAGKFASTFGDVAGVPKSGAANPFTILDAGYMLPAGAINPAAYALPLGRVGARYGLLSGPAQRAMSAPAYQMSPALRAAGGLLGQAPVGSTVLGLEAFGQ